MNWPKISIVTPSFNQAEFLEASIQSILTQNYPNLDYAIVDGGSTDGSVEIIKRYEEKLSWWCSEPDEGQYHAINKGFERSTGEIMAWLNSDDMYCPWAFKTVASILSEIPETEWLTTLRPGNWDYHGYCTGFDLVPGYSREAFLDGRYIPAGVKTNVPVLGTPISMQQECTFWRRSLWEKVGGQVSTQFNLAADFDLWSRFYAHAELYGTLSPLGGFRVQENQRSRQLNQYVAEAEKSLANMRQTFKWRPKPSRALSLSLRFPSIPRLRVLTRGMYNYRGRRVVRKNGDSPDGFWQVEEYQFF
jgi:glycosyltransferase involved in cell wall biosynthesis